MPDEFPPPPGSWSPVDISTSERRSFPQITRYPVLYLALRNTVLFLWNEDPKRLVTCDLVQSRLIIRGLLRVLLIEQWLPRLLAELTRLGMINFGVCAAPVNPAANTADRPATLNISSLSSQADLSMYVEPPVCLFSQTEHGLVKVDRPLAERMEFHVEALFDQVVFEEPALTGHDNSSVQATAGREIGGLLGVIIELLPDRRSGNLHVDRRTKFCKS
ncbi:unnamed protein product [Dibothriocephalus latus]|uniref:SWIRM domain-containing protein n=1 Tax=Dibothriocephalus latus TaxID=60516 RepID=A0A3P7L7W6_DIBLA|nr:unnamed protein product [Dibothriocephalus latus]